MVLALIVAATVVAVLALAWRRRYRRGRVGPESYGGVDDFRKAMDAIAPEHDDPSQ